MNTQSPTPPKIELKNVKRHFGKKKSAGWY